MMIIIASLNIWCLCKVRKVNKSSHRQICDTPAEKSWQLSKWLLKQSVINIHSSLQNNFLVRHWPVALVGREGRKKTSALTDFIFLTDITVLLIFSFPAMVPRPVYNPSDHPNTCVYVWNITLDFCTSVPPHSTPTPSSVGEKMGFYYCTPELNWYSWQQIHHSWMSKMIEYSFICHK